MRRSKPTMGMVADYIDAMPRDARGYLNVKCGITDESIVKYKIGFRAADMRNTFPVYSARGILLNIRYHNPRLNPAIINHPKFGQDRLWGADRLANAPPGSTICVTSGEFDAMMVEQETGLVSVAPTNGKSAFDYSFVKGFFGHYVVLLQDCDKSGRASLEKVLLPAFQNAVVSGKVLSLKIVWLYSNVTSEDEKGFTDYILRSGKSGGDLIRLIETTEPHQYSPEDVVDPIPDSNSFFDGRTFVTTEVVDHMLSRYNLFHDGAFFFCYDKAKGVYELMPDPLVSRDIKRTIGRRTKVKHMSDAMRMIQCDTFKTPDELMMPPNLINMTNGVLDIEHGKLLKHNKKYLSRIQVPIRYDPKAKCPRWDRFLLEVFPEDPGKATALQDYAGYCFIHNIPFEKCLFLIGEGANGKSVFIKILCDIIGLKNASFLDPQMIASRFVIGTIKDKLLNVASEIDTHAEIAANIFNKIISGDRIQADVKYRREPITFFPIAKHIFSMNEVPVVTKRSFAFERRLIIVRFNQTFVGQDADYRLHRRLQGELPGIFNWAIVGLNRIMKDFAGIYESPRMLTDKEFFMRRIKPVIAFIEERCVIAQGEAVIKTGLYKEYCKWCAGCDVRVLSRFVFYKEMLETYQSVFENQQRKGATRYLKGIGVKS